MEKNNVINLDEAINKTSKLLDNLNKLNNFEKPLCFINADDLVKATGLSKRTVLNIFNDPEFPSCDFGKTKIAEINAVIEYFSVPRKKEYSVYWKNLCVA